VNCFAGCAPDKVVAALGLSMRDLLLNPAKREPKRIVATYDYHDANGNVVAQKVRYEPKKFYWRIQTADGGWIWKLSGRIVGLYQLPDLVDARQVIVVEGEKAVELLRRKGLSATCPPKGAGLWRDEWSLNLCAAGAVHVVILADNDRIGIQHAEGVAASCYQKSVSLFDKAQNVIGTSDPLHVKVLLLPGLPTGGDVVDFLDRHDVTELRELIQNSPFWTPHRAQEAKLERRRALTRARVRRHRERQRAARRMSNHVA
jgi:hypothetical protein